MPGAGFARGPGRACHFEDTQAPPAGTSQSRPRVAEDADAAALASSAQVLIHEPPTPSPVRAPAWLEWGASCW
jgi:hypothetical protein